MVLSAFAAAPLLAASEAHLRRDLLGGGEIFMRGFSEAAAIERDEALVAAHISALVDGHGEMALAEQLAGGLAIAKTACIKAGIGAQAIGRLEVDHQKGNRTIGPGLQDEATLELQGRSEQGRQHDGLAQQLAD